MAILYDIEGTEIYAGRGKYSRRARIMIDERVAYKRDDEGNLVVHVPENQPAPSSRPSTLDEDVHTLKRDAQRLGQQLGLGLDELEVRRDTPEGVLIAHLKQITPALVAGLDSEQAAKLMQTMTHWMLRRGLNVHEHEELVNNLHQLINGMRAPAQGASLLNRDDSLVREDGVNIYPGTPTSNVYNELWVHAFLPPNDHHCRPSVTRADDQHVDVHSEGQTWFEPALHAGPEFVCENLHRVSNLRTFRQGRHGIIRVFLPYNSQRNFMEEDFSNRMNDRHHMHEQEISPDNEPWSHCLQRFVDACAAIKNNGVRSDLRLFIHRGSETPQEVIL